MGREYFIQVEDEAPFGTEYQYTEGEVITVNSNEQCKCMEIEVLSDKTIYHFVRPLTRWPTKKEYNNRSEGECVPSLTIKEKIENMLVEAKKRYEIPYQNKEDYDNCFGKMEVLEEVLDLFKD